MSLSLEKPPSQLGGVIVIAVFVVLFGSIAALFVYAGLQKIENERRIASDPVQTAAVIVEVEKIEATGKGGDTWLPTVEFDSEGELVEVELESIGSMSRYEVGDAISVTYQAGHPSTAVETSRRGEVRDVLILPAVFAGISLAFLIFGSVNWLAFRRRFYRARGMVKS